MAGPTILQPSGRALANERSVFSKTDLFWLLPFLVVSIFPVFWQLTAIPIRQWDEARLAVNAAEMIKNGDLLVTYYQGQPDLWNTKPPLQIWLIALSIKIFGYTEFAVRFPTVVALLATMSLLFWFCISVFKNKFAAVISVLVLVSSQGYMGYHVGRNGDYDATLVFFITLYALSFFRYLETFDVKQVGWFFAGLTLAVLTKGVAGLLCLPALFLYLLYQRRFIFLLKQKPFWLFSLGFLVFVFGYYFLREVQNPGYLEAVYDNELGGRYLTTLEAHSHPWNWYLDLMQEVKYPLWFFLLPFCAWLLLWQPSPLIKRFAVYGVIFIALFLLIISTAKTKLYWYDAPLYPMAALILGLGIDYIMQVLSKDKLGEQASIFKVMALLLLIWGPYYHVLDRYLEEKGSAREWAWETMFGPVMKQLAKDYPNQKEVIFLHNNNLYNAAAYFYQLAFEAQGYRITNVSEDLLQNFKTGEVLVVCSEILSNRLQETYLTETLHVHYKARAYRILAKK